MLGKWLHKRSPEANTCACAPLFVLQTLWRSFAASTGPFASERNTYKSFFPAVLAIVQRVQVHAAHCSSLHVCE